MSLFRSCLFAIGYFVVTTSYGAFSLPLRYLPPLTRHRIIISWTHVIIAWARISCGIRYRVIGLEKLNNQAGPFVVLSKHQSAWETFFLQGIFFPASTVLKKELLSIPFFGWGLAALQPIAIDRSNPKQALKDVKTQGQARLESGLNLILFPEGTRVPIGQRVKYARSGVDIAKSSGKAIVPVAHNAAQCWGEGKQFIKTAGVITVVIGDAIDTETRNTKEIIADVENWIENTLDDIVNNRL